MKYWLFCYQVQVVDPEGAGDLVVELDGLVTHEADDDRLGLPIDRKVLRYFGPAGGTEERIGAEERILKVGSKYLDPRSFVGGKSIGSGPKAEPISAGFQ